MTGGDDNGGGGGDDDDDTSSAPQDIRDDQRLAFAAACRGCARRDVRGEFVCGDCGMGKCRRCGGNWDQHTQCLFCAGAATQSQMR